MPVEFGGLADVPFVRQAGRRQVQQIPDDAGDVDRLEELFDAPPRSARFPGWCVGTMSG